jgi:hypothetical protein
VQLRQPLLRDEQRNALGLQPGAKTKIVDAA